jgi:hypothetical protein
MSLTLNVTNRFSSPVYMPNVRVDYSAAGAWARASATKATMPRTATVSPGYGTPAMSPGWVTYPITVGARSWAADVAAHTLTLGVSNSFATFNVSNTYSDAYYDNVELANKPYLSLTTCE